MTASQKGSVISGTLSVPVLIRAFEAELARIGEPMPVRERHSDVDWLTALFDALEGSAPEGHYFGAHPGDGSDFGYWEIEE